MKWPFGEKSTSPSGFGGQILYMSHINHYLQDKKWPNGGGAVIY